MVGVGGNITAGLKGIDLLFRVRHDKNLEPFLFKLVARLNDDGKLLA